MNKSNIIKFEEVLEHSIDSNINLRTHEPFANLNYDDEYKFKEYAFKKFLHLNGIKQNPEK